MKRVIALAAACCFAAVSGQAGEEATMEEKPVKLKVGDAAPDVKLPKPGRADDSDEMVKLSDYEGKKNVVLAFYPKAFTGGCTKQLCTYRDDYAARFKSTDTEVFAISIDEQGMSDDFRDEYEMPFTVVGDPKHAIIKAYGVPMIDFNGQQFAKRSIYVIDKDGRIAYVDEDYIIDQDRDALYAALDELAPVDEPSEAG